MKIRKLGDIIILTNCPFEEIGCMFEQNGKIRLYGSWYSNRPAWTHSFNAKIGF